VTPCRTSGPAVMVQRKVAHPASPRRVTLRSEISSRRGGSAAERAQHALAAGDHAPILRDVGRLRVQRRLVIRQVAGVVGRHRALDFGRQVVGRGGGTGRRSLRCKSEQSRQHQGIHGTSRRVCFGS
jgi:hypothetical protein